MKNNRIKSKIFPCLQGISKSKYGNTFFPLVCRRQSSTPLHFLIPLWNHLISHEHVNVYTRTAAIFMCAPAAYYCLSAPKDPTTPKTQLTIQPTTVFSLSPRSSKNPTIAELVLGKQPSDPQDQSQFARQPRRV